MFDDRMQQYAVEQTVLMVKEKLQEHYTAVHPGLTIPDEVFGFTDDVLTVAVEDADSIRIWCDSAKPLKKYQTLGYVQYLLTIGIFVTYSGGRFKYGVGKRRRADAIISCVNKWWPAYYGDGCLEFNTASDLRFAAERMDGGSSKSLKGKDKPQGHNKEAFTVALSAIVRVRHDVAFSR